MAKSEQEGGKATPQAWPAIPDYLKDPIVFEDKNLGLAMVAKWVEKQWVFRVHNGHWCSVRETNGNDPLFIKPLNSGDAQPEAPAPQAESEQRWHAIDSPPTTSSSASIRVLGMLEDGTHVFAIYTPFYLGKEDEAKYLWVCDNYPWSYKPKWWQYLDPLPPVLDRTSQPSRPVEEVAKECVEIVLSEVGNFDGKDRAIQRVRQLLAKDRGL